MKIALPAEGTDISQPFASVFGRCSNFVIIESTNQEIVKSFTNTAQNASGGAGIQAAQSLIDQQIDVVIAPRLGPNAWDVLKGAGVTIYTGVNGTLEQNIKAFLEGKLMEMVIASGLGSGRGRGRGRGLSRRNS